MGYPIFMMDKGAMPGQQSDVANGITPRAHPTERTPDTSPVKLNWPGQTRSGLFASLAPMVAKWRLIRR